MEKKKRAKSVNCSKCGETRTGSHVSYCLSCYAAWKRARYAQNREKEVARVMAYNYANYERFKQKLYAYRETEPWKAVAKKWKQDNKDKVRSYDRKKRAMRSMAEGTHTKEDVLKILNLQKHKCAECRADLRKVGYEVDHIFPLSKGGSNWPNNLQCLCRECNIRKSATDPIAWAAKKGRLL